jgi:hypothetical protein
MTFLLRAALWPLLLPALTAQEPPPPPVAPPAKPAFGSDWNPAVPLGGNVRQTRFDLAPTFAWLAVPEREAQLAATPEGLAFLLLGWLANGSTMRSGPDKDRIRTRVANLRDRLQPDGTFRGFEQPPTRREQLLLTLAIEDAFARSNYQLLRPLVERAAATCITMARAEPALPAEEFALLACLAERLARHAAPLVDRAAECRAAAVAARVGLAFRTSPRADAAMHLGDRLLGRELAPATRFDSCWPANPGADPLHTWFAVLATATDDAATLARITGSLDKLLTVRTGAGADAGCWPATGGLDAARSTAMLAAALAQAGQQFAATAAATSQPPAAERGR